MHIPIEKKKEIILKLFELIKQQWEVYLPLSGDNKFVILKTICSKCGANWYVDEKECFSCKTRHLRAIKCPHCGKIIAEENLHYCPYCKKDPSSKLKGKRGCLTCGKSGDGQFVPITFCSKCGNRQNKFEWKIISF